MTAAVVATCLGMRYGRRPALQECSLEIPTGSVTALVGPNGAGKSTFLLLCAGLLEPTSGTLTVLGRIPHQDTDVLARVGFVAQDVPLYGSFTVDEMLRFGRIMNRRWDDGLARERLRRLDIPPAQRVRELSGGQRAQVALALALGKRPDLLLLDEPLASLDPLARREFLRMVMETAAESGITIVLSSHLLADLERVCDHLIVLSASRTQVAGSIESLLDCHRVLTGPAVPADGRDLAGVAAVVERTDTDRQTTLFVRTDGHLLHPRWTAEPVTLEDLVLAYLARPAATALPAPRVVAEVGS